MKLREIKLTPPIVAISAMFLVLTGSVRAAGQVRFVDNIETKEGQYVLLDYVPKSNSVVKTRIAVPSLGSSNYAIFCSRGAEASDNTFTLFWIKSKGYRWDYATVNTVMSKSGITENLSAEIECSGNGCWLNGVKIPAEYEPVDYEPANRMMLFASYTGDPSETPVASDNFAKVRFYSMQILEEGKLKVDLWPCVDENGRYGIYDKIAEKTYYSASGTDFAPRFILKPGHDYVIDGDKGAGPEKIYVNNASLTLTNGAWLDFTNTQSAKGTNFTMYITGGSVVTNQSNITPGSYAHVVVDEGSVLWWKTSNTHCSDVANRFNVFAFTNATFFMAGNTSLYGHDSVLLMHNTTVDGGSTLQIGGTDNVCVFSGATMFPSKKTLAVYNGTNTWVRIADNTVLKVNNGGKIQSYTDGTNGFYVGKNAYLYFGGSGIYSADTARHGRIIVDEGGEMSVYNGDGGGILGIDYQWITTNGTFSCSNHMVRVGDKLTDVDCRLVLVGDQAKFYVKNFNIGNASSNGTVTVVLRPGPTGYNGVAPIWSTAGGTISGGVFDIDMREAMQQVEPGKVYRLPVARTSSSMTLAAATLEKLNLTARLLPEDAQLVKEGNILYCVARRQKGLMILVR